MLLDTVVTKIILLENIGHVTGYSCNQDNTIGICHLLLLGWSKKCN